MKRITSALRVTAASEGVGSDVGRYREASGSLDVARSLRISTIPAFILAA
jgi:hypothetical protein